VYTNNSKLAFAFSLDLHLECSFFFFFLACPPTKRKERKVSLKENSPHFGVHKQNIIVVTTLIKEI
jgi:hypothetical protein